jgi:hypothetical protein
VRGKIERPRRVAFYLLGSVCLLLGCRSDAERAEQGRVANLAERIDRLRRADNPGKRPLLQALEASACVSADACALKDLCVRAYQVHQRALDSIESLKHLAASDAGTGVSEPVRERLRQAEQDLATARELGERCAEEQVRTVRKVLM